jgi:signal transduction histidine kinase
VNRRLLALSRLSIRTRLALVYGGAFFCMGLGLIAISYAIVDHSLSPAATGRSVARFVAIQGGAFGLPDDSLPGITVARVPPPAVSGGVVSGGVDSVADPRSAVSVPNPGALPDAGSVGMKLQSLLTDVRVQTLRSLLLTWAGLTGLMALGAGLFGWLLAARMLKPLRDITGAARRLSAENLHERIKLEGRRDELKELADTFDSMLGRLDAAFSSQRRFVANASHELRTPLAIMRAQIDVALSDPAVTRTELIATSRVVHDAVDRCERLMDGLLVLARSDRGLDAAEPVDLAEAAARAMDQVSAAAAERGIQLRSALKPAAVRGDQSLLDRMVANLLENAVAYNLPSGWVEVWTSNGSDRARLRVANSGPRVPPEQVTSLFEPFRRLSRDRTGSGRGAGLGLSIVRSVARAHGGEARARPRTSGGLMVEVELPAAPLHAT